MATFRLWGWHGQTAIEKAHVLVLGAGPIATESLKNLVLPSMQTIMSLSPSPSPIPISIASDIGSFTLVDDAVVTESDCGQNFFLERDQVLVSPLSLSPSSSLHFHYRHHSISITITITIPIPIHTNIPINITMSSLSPPD